MVGGWHVLGVLSTAQVGGTVLSKASWSFSGHVTSFLLTLAYFTGWATRAVGQVVQYTTPRVPFAQAADECCTLELFYVAVFLMEVLGEKAPLSSSFSSSLSSSLSLQITDAL